MKIALISFTSAGARLCRRIETGLSARGHDCIAFGKDSYAGEAGILPLSTGLDQWTAEAFLKQEALIFIGACGIAVRAIAPYVKNKTIDPAVVVVDEKAKYAISLLSGHLGGANDLTKEIGGIIGAESVITTATDLNNRFAADDWAKKNHLRIGSMQTAKEISAAVLNGEIIGVSSEFPIHGPVPEQLSYIDSSGCPCNGKETAVGNHFKLGVRVSIHEEDGPFVKTLHLIPRTVTVGIGCRKGIPPETAEEVLYKVLEEYKLSIYSIEKLCSIDIKEKEAALKQLADKLCVSIQFFSSEELGQVEGNFTASEFVKQITGVDNICERAAVLGSRGDLIVKKRSLNGVTVAMAVRKEEYRWIQE